MPYRHNHLAITNIHTMSKIYISDDIGQKQCGMEYYLTIKKNKIMPFGAKQMDLEVIILSEVSQKEKDKYHMVSLPRGF